MFLNLFVVGVSMKQLPDPRAYERENTFFPWGNVITLVTQEVVSTAPQRGSVLDLACGPGFLLGKIHERRPDLVLEGVDSDERYISWARTKYPFAQFTRADVLEWKPCKKYDVITCTAGIHHLPYEQQEPFLRRIPSWLAPSGVFIAADPYIDDYHDEKTRKSAAARLGHEYLLASMDRSAPDDMLEAAIDIMHNDVLGFEFKTSLRKLEPIFREVFRSIAVHKTWPSEETEYGEYAVVCRR